MAFVWRLRQSQTQTLIKHTKIKCSLTHSCFCIARGHTALLPNTLVALYYTQLNSNRGAPSRTTLSSEYPIQNVAARERASLSSRYASESRRHAAPARATSSVRTRTDRRDSQLTALCACVLSLSASPSFSLSLSEGARACSVVVVVRVQYEQSAVPAVRRAARSAWRASAAASATLELVPAVQPRAATAAADERASVPTTTPAAVIRASARTSVRLRPTESVWWRPRSTRRSWIERARAADDGRPSARLWRSAVGRSSRDWWLPRRSAEPAGWRAAAVWRRSAVVQRSAAARAGCRSARFPRSPWSSDVAACRIPARRQWRPWQYEPRPTDDERSAIGRPWCRTCAWSAWPWRHAVRRATAARHGTSRSADRSTDRSAHGSTNRSADGPSECKRPHCAVLADGTWRSASCWWSAADGRSARCASAANDGRTWRTRRSTGYGRTDAQWSAWSWRLCTAWSADEPAAAAAGAASRSFVRRRDPKRQLPAASRHDGYA